MKKVVLIGDSIRMAYQPYVAAKLLGKADVWGPEENCRHCLWALDHFQEWVAPQKPDILHFNFGIHDALKMADGQPQILLVQYCLCLKRFITQARKLETRLIWATTTPRYHKCEGLPMSQWPEMTEIDDYNAAALEIVRAEGLEVNDLHQVILTNDYTKCLHTDGCHLQELGRKVLSDAVAMTLRNHLTPFLTR